MLRLKKKLISVVANFIANKHKRQNFRRKHHEKLEYEYSKKHYKKTLSKLSLRVNQGKKIRVAFTVVYDSVFPAEPLFEELLKHTKFFDATIVVIPDTLRGYDNEVNILNKTYSTLRAKYGEHKVINVLVENTYQDILQSYDICCFANPYDGMTHKFYTFDYLRHKDLLPIIVTYFYNGRHIYERDFIKSGALSKYWKVFVENNFVKEIFNEYSPNKDKNVIVSGYCKMDMMSQVKLVTTRVRKRIIIAPHHTVLKTKYAVSTFLAFSDFFMHLFKEYQNLDFVFRPHPLLFVTLLNNKIWTQPQISDYLNALKLLSNVEYQDGGDYFDTFANSDGLIHDCGSYMAEYMYTDKPQCYLYLGDNFPYDKYLEFGQSILKHSYLANSRTEIESYIKDVILEGKDTKRDERIKWAQKNVMINYPNVSAIIKDYLIHTIKTVE